MKNYFKMKYILLISAFVLFSLGLQAQQEHQFTQFMYNKVYYNPAFAGSRGVSSVTALYRNQWLGFEGSPISKLVSFETPLMNQNAGLGLLVANHNEGLMNSWQGTMSYNYNIKFSETVGLRFGLSGSLRTFSIDFSDPNTARVSQQGDPSIPTGEVTSYNGNFGIGAVMEFSKFHVGFSVPNMFENEIGEDNGQPNIALYSRHYYGVIGARPNITENIVLQPTLMTSYVKGSPIEIDFNLSLLFNNTFLVGSSYRHGGTSFAESIDFNLFYQVVPRFGLGAAYDLHLGDVAELGSGSIEILARFDFGANAGGNGIGGSSKNKLANPRYFF